MERVLEGGARWIWFRERDMEQGSRRRLACETLTLVRAAGGVLTLGGDVDLAMAIGAEGVHLPGAARRADIERAREAMPEGLIGVSAHSLDDVETAARGGADYATLSPIFTTFSKPGYGPALGVEALRSAAVHGLPLVALGGITPQTAPACRDARASGIAVMGGLMQAPDPAAAATDLLRAWSQRPEGP